MPTIINDGPLNDIVRRANALQRANPHLSPPDAIDAALTEQQRMQHAQTIDDAQVAKFAANSAAIWQTYLDKLTPDERQAVEARARR